MADAVRARPTEPAVRCPLCHGALDARAAAVVTCPACATPAHAACARELAVPCTTLGCARATRTAAEARTAADPKAPPRPGLVVPLVLAWALFVVFPYAAWVPGLWAGARGWRRARGRGLARGLLLSPLGLPVLAALWAAFGYATGTACLQGVGLPGFGYRNLDRQLRCHRSSSGCVVTGHELYLQPPNNLTLRALGAVFGPMPGAYDGPYPDAEAAQALLAAAPALAPGAPLKVGGRTLALTPEAERLLAAATDGLREGPDGVPLRLALVEERLAVVGDATGAVLVDVGDGAVVAAYRFERWR